MRTYNIFVKLTGLLLLVYCGTVFASQSGTDTQILPGITTYGDMLSQGELNRIAVMDMNSPPHPPVGVSATVVTSMSQTAVMLSNVPTSTWTYGCSATSAGMIFGYYDRNGYPNMYTGPANGGVAPLTDLGNNCSIIATRNGFDGRTVRGHVDDYWTGYGNSGPDPWEGNWSEHSWGDCTADFMGTNQWKWDFSSWPNVDGSKDRNTDGATSLFMNNDGTRLYDFVPPSQFGLPQTELCHGMRLFAVSRGYTVLENYTQRIAPLTSGGFSFADFMAEINAGYPVMIQLVGHSMVGVGYNADSQTIYVHDTWDNSVHSMTWGGSYSGMSHVGVTVIHLQPCIVATITSQPSPSSVTICSGQSYQWCVGASGATSYQWQKDGSNISGATSSCYSATQAGSYRCVVSNSCGSVTSNSVALTVCATPNITQHPQNTTVFVGQDAVFTVTASGCGPLYYQWKKNGGNVGTDNSTLTLSNVPLSDDGAQITCDVSNTCGTVTSNPATLRVKLAINASSGPNGSVAPNGVFDVNIGQNLTFTATADDGFMVDQWRVDSNLAQIGGVNYTLSDIQANHTVYVTFRPIVSTLYVDANSPNDPGSGTQSDPFRKIQYGIDTAIDGITVIVAQGRYYENISFNGKNITLTSTDPNDPCVVAATIIDGSQSSSVVTVTDSNFTLDGFTITNGLAANGGGVHCEWSNVSFSKCVIADNKTVSGESNWNEDPNDGGYGAGIYCTSSSLTLKDCSVIRNITGNGGGGFSYDGGKGGDGGGIYCTASCSLTLEGCLISNNISGSGGSSGDGHGGPAGDGGGIYCSTAMLINSTIISNRTGNGGYGEYGWVGARGGHGGGIYCESGDVNIVECLVRDNMTGSGGWSNCEGAHGGSGGGIYCTSSATPMIFGSLIVNNITGNGSGTYGGYHETVGGFGGSGAGVLCFSGVVRNCVITDNVTGNGGNGDQYGFPATGGNGGDGSGIFGPSAAIENCTISQNTTGVGGTGGSGGSNGADGKGGGVYADSSTEVANSILWSNVPSDINGHNCANVAFSDISDGNCAGQNSNIVADPCFANPDNNDFHLLPGSPCIDTGDPNHPIDSNEHDIDGDPRIINGRIDIGADEYKPSGNLSDFNFDGIVNFNDYAIFVSYWPQYLCSEPDWCEGRDYDHNGAVDLEDLARFSEDWLWAEEVRDFNLVGYWKFDEGTGQFAMDSSGYGNRGHLRNGTAWQNDALYFDGINDWVEVNDSNSLKITNKLTISVWINMPQYSTNFPKVVIKPYTEVADPYELITIDLSHYGTYPRFIITDGMPGGNFGYAMNSSYTLSLNHWYQIAGTYDGSTVKLYVNGVLINSNPSTITIGDNDMPVSIGSCRGDYAFNGLVNYVRVYNRALTQSEVADLYTLELPLHQ
jgi:hypothetical protein